MTSTYNYMFDNLTRVNEDSAGITERDLQNQGHNNYTTANHVKHRAGMEEPIGFATGQPNIFYKGPHGAIDGSTIDDESNLLISSSQTNTKCKLNLQTRRFVSVPYLGRGPHNPDIESKLLQGSFIDPKKSCKQETEKSYNREKTSLVKSVRHSIQNPRYLIESSARKDWVRGGLPSRQLVIEENMKN